MTMFNETHLLDASEHMQIKRLKLAFDYYRIAGFIAALCIGKGYSAGREDAKTSAETLAAVLVGHNTDFTGGVFGPSMRTMSDKVRLYTDGLLDALPDDYAVKAVSKLSKRASSDIHCMPGERYAFNTLGKRKEETDADTN